MRAIRLLVGLLVVMSIAEHGRCADAEVVLELALANQTPSVSSSADWGWWNPGKYPGAWSPDEDSSFGVADARMLVIGRPYTVVLGGEWYPTLDAVGSLEVPGSTEPEVQELRLKTGIYDLGFGCWFGPDDRTGVLPWIGATYMDISERLDSTPPPDSAVPPSSGHATAGLWGAVVGADASITVWESLDLAGRLLFRWATGTRSAWIETQDPGGGSGGGEVKVSDSIDHAMWGFDLGVRWHATRALWFEAGWRLRDRTLDDGPASFGGPQLKVAYEF